KINLTKDELVEHIIEETPEWTIEFNRAVREVQAKEAGSYKTNGLNLVSGSPKNLMTWNPSFFKNALTGKALEQIVKHEMFHLLHQGMSIEQAKEHLLAKKPDDLHSLNEVVEKVLSGRAEA